MKQKPERSLVMCRSCIHPWKKDFNNQLEAWDGNINQSKAPNGDSSYKGQKDDVNYIPWNIN